MGLLQHIDDMYEPDLLDDDQEKFPELKFIELGPRIIGGRYTAMKIVGTKEALSEWWAEWQGSGDPEEDVEELEHFFKRQVEPYEEPDPLLLADLKERRSGE